DPGRLHGRVPAGRGRVSAGREPLPDLRRRDRLPGFLSGRARRLSASTGQRRVGGADGTHRRGGPPVCLPGRAEVRPGGQPGKTTKDGEIMNRLAGKNALITGASGGLGRQLAVDFAGAGVGGLALVARTADALGQVRQDVLEAAPQTRVVVITADLTREEDVERVVATA